MSRESITAGKFYDEVVVALGKIYAIDITSYEPLLLDNDQQDDHPTITEAPECT
jgi:hypothetical protein